MTNITSLTTMTTLFSFGNRAQFKNTLNRSQTLLTIWCGNQNTIEDITNKTLIAMLDTSFRPKVERGNSKFRPCHIQWTKAHSLFSRFVRSFDIELLQIASLVSKKQRMNTNTFFHHHIKEVIRLPSTLLNLSQKTILSTNQT